MAKPARYWTLHRGGDCQHLGERSYRRGRRQRRAGRIPTQGKDVGWRGGLGKRERSARAHAAWRLQSSHDGTGRHYLPAATTEMPVVSGDGLLLDARGVAFAPRRPCTKEAHCTLRALADRKSGFPGATRSWRFAHAWDVGTSGVARAEWREAVVLAAALDHGHRLCSSRG